MFDKIHFISGLPRSGSTLLAALLSQNPRFHSAMSSPVGPIFDACLSAMGAENEFALFLDDQQKRDILLGIFRGYYRDENGPDTVFDTNRMWTARLPALVSLFPEAKVICCVRNPAWILDSVEQLVRKNALDSSRIFNNRAERATVFSRAEALINRNRMIGFALASLKEAYYGAEADRLLIVDYDVLAARPEDTLNLVYEFLGEEPYTHDFDNVSYTAEHFDSHMLAKGLHTIEGKVEPKLRRTVLPPELFRQFQDFTFWTNPAESRAFHIVPKT